MEKAKADHVFEVSWEVCNKVGGIFTVVQSKAAQMVDIYDKNYFMIGPYFEDHAAGQFQEGLPPEELRPLLNEMRNKGIICHFGKWVIKGNPNVMLLDVVQFSENINKIKGKLWEDYKIDSLKAGHDFNEPVVWSYAVGVVLEKARSLLKGKIVAHFHEWLSGAAILYLKKKNVDIGTVFTTHATVLGRCLASNNVDLYCIDNEDKCALEKMDVEKEAYKYGVYAKHQVERSSAQNADIFTTVSEITGLEATFILKRKPDVLIHNGLDMRKFPSFEDISLKHIMHKNRINEFLMYYFFPYYKFSLKDALIYFIAGRYEFHDKGIDVFIKSLGKLNEKLKKEKSVKTIVAFIWVPTMVRGIKTELIENRVLYEDIKDLLQEVTQDVEKNIIYSFVSKMGFNEKDIFDEDFLLELRSKVLKFSKKGKPPLSTHNVPDENDTILKTIKESGLNNNKEDKVKVIFYPIYLSGADGLLDLSYYEAMQGSHLGVFPSFYEPWGYTPLEAGALGIASVTTDLAGFGRYIVSTTKPSDRPGVFVLKRQGRKQEEIVNDLTDVMYNYSKLNRHERIENKINARKIAGLADWKILINNYIRAHNMAIEKR